MEKYLTHTAEEYRQAVKVFKALVAMPPDKKRRGPAYEHERAMTSLALEALRHAALLLENPPLTRAHLKEMHGQAVYSEQPGLSAGIIDCRSETIVTLGPQGTYRDEWFHGLPGRYYRFPVTRPAQLIQQPLQSSLPVPLDGPVQDIDRDSPGPH